MPARWYSHGEEDVRHQTTLRTSLPHVLLQKPPEEIQDTCEHGELNVDCCPQVGDGDENRGRLVLLRILEISGISLTILVFILLDLSDFTSHGLTPPPTV